MPRSAARFTQADARRIIAAAAPASESFERSGETDQKLNAAGHCILLPTLARWRLK